MSTNSFLDINLLSLLRHVEVDVLVPPQWRTAGLRSRPWWEVLGGEERDGEGEQTDECDVDLNLGDSSSAARSPVLTIRDPLN